LRLPNSQVDGNRLREADVRDVDKSTDGRPAYASFVEVGDRVVAILQTVGDRAATMLQAAQEVAERTRREAQAEAAAIRSQAEKEAAAQIGLFRREIEPVNSERPTRAQSVRDEGERFVIEYLGEGNGEAEKAEAQAQRRRASPVEAARKPDKQRQVALKEASEALEVRLRVALQSLQQFSADLEEILAQALPGDEVKDKTETRVASGRRRPRDLGRLAYLADLYSKACLISSAPNVAVAPELDCTPAQVKTLVSQARRDKLLSETKPGRAGGELTDLGRRSLDGYLSRDSEGGTRERRG